MNVLNYFLIFVVAFAVVDVNGFPAKNKQDKSVVRHKKRVPEKHAHAHLKLITKSIRKRPKRHIPPELIAKHQKTMRCLRHHLHNHRLGLYQPYHLPLIHNPVKYEPIYPWTPNHPTPNTFKHSKKTEKSKIKLVKHVPKIQKVEKDVKPPGLGSYLEEDIKKAENEVVFKEEKKTENRRSGLEEKETSTEKAVSPHPFSDSATTFKNGYQVHEIVEEDDWRDGNLVKDREISTTKGHHFLEKDLPVIAENDDATRERAVDEELSTELSDKKSEEEELVTESWESKKMKSEDDNMEHGMLAEPIDLLRIIDKKKETTSEAERKLDLPSTTYLPEEGRNIGTEELTERSIEVTTLLKQRLFTDVETNLEPDTITEGKSFPDVEKNVDSTTQNFHRNIATTVIAEEKSFSEDARNIDTGATVTEEARLFTEVDRNLEATTFPESRMFTEVDGFPRNAEGTTFGKSQLIPEIERDAESATTSKTMEIGRNMEATTVSEARNLESEEVLVDTKEYEATTPQARFIPNEDEATFRNSETEATPETRHVQTDNEMLRNIDAFPSSEATFLETHEEITQRNVEETTPSEARFLDIEEKVTSRNVEETTPSEARFMDIEEKVTSRNVEGTKPPEDRFLDTHEEITSRNLEFTTPSDARFLEIDEEVTLRNIEATTSAEARFLESAEGITSKNLESTTLQEARSLETDEEMTPKNVETTVLPEARFLETELREDEGTTPDSRLVVIDEGYTPVRNFQETTTSFEDALKQERKLHYDPYLESNHLDYDYPGKTESNDIYEEDKTNPIRTTRPLSDTVHDDVNSKNMTSPGQTIDITTEKRRSDVLIVDDYHEYFETNETTPESSNFTIIDPDQRYTPPTDFNPESLIQIIPVIINDLRSKSMPAEDKKVLSEIFGKFWPFLEQLSQDPNLNITQLLRIKNENDLKNFVDSFGKLQDQENEDLELAETESFSYSTIRNDPSLYEYVDDHQEVSYDSPDEIIEEEKETSDFPTEKETSDFHSRSSDEFSFGEFQSDFNGFESEDNPETFGESDYELADDLNENYYESNPSGSEIFDDVKNERLPSSKTFSDSPFSDSDNFFL